MDKKAFIINTASYERVAYALSIAATLATLGKKVSVLFGYEGVLRLKKGYVDKIGEEIDERLRKALSEGVEKGSLLKISEIIRLLRSFGGKVYACPTAMALHNLTRDDLIDDVDDVRGLASFLTEEAKDAMIIYV
jgi:peroxiredoxin family protein